MKPIREEPGPGQESVWDYPRPPKLEACSGHIVIEYQGRRIVDTHHAYRVLETSHPPNYYIPPQDVDATVLEPGTGGSFCEWKGRARYHTVVVDGHRLENVGWSYPLPTGQFGPIKDYLAFYAAPMDRCLVDDEQVTPQPGGFYGGWITSKVVGPFKGGPGSMWW